MFLAKFESIRFNRNIIEFYKCSLREGGIFARKVLSPEYLMRELSNPSRIVCNLRVRQLYFPVSFILNSFLKPQLYIV